VALTPQAAKPTTVTPTAPYADLGGFQLPAATTANATTGLANPFGSGYALMTLTADITFHLDVALAELYHMYVNAPPGTAFQIYKNQLQWDYVLVGVNAWDPAQPMPIRPGDTVTMFFNQVATSNITGTAWLRQPLVAK
jgi:hypothetical protein